MAGGQDEMDNNLKTLGQPFQDFWLFLAQIFKENVVWFALLSEIYLLSSSWV